jgi:enoyl-CoA hydratase/carnithine racemase
MDKSWTIAARLARARAHPSPLDRAARTCHPEPSIVNPEPSTPTLLHRWFEAEPAVLPAGEPLACIHDGSVAHVVLNQPDKRNAMNAAMWAGLAPLMARLEADATVRLVVFRGAGAEAFSAGADISEFAATFATPESTARYNADVRRAQLAVERLAKPTLAVIHGACVGGGCGLALACDLRFASHESRFAIPASKLGVAYSVPDTRRLVALVGAGRAKDILFSGRLLDAAEAAAIGLATRVVPGIELEQAAADYARGLHSNSPQAMATAKAIVNSLSGVHVQADQVLEERFTASFSSEDFREGYTAFLEKRRPTFG